VRSGVWASAATQEWLGAREINYLPKDDRHRLF